MHPIACHVPWVVECSSSLQKLVSASRQKRDDAFQMHAIYGISTPCEGETREKEQTNASRNVTIRQEKGQDMMRGGEDMI